jgi:phosphonate transport system substrate-binding protein
MGFARVFCGIFLCVALSGVAGAAPLRVGILPTNGTLFLLQLYKPFRAYLEGRLKTPVELYTASDYPAFLRQVQGKEFDLVVTAPHFAALAEEQSGYRGLVRFARKLQPLVVVGKDSPAHGAKQLKGAVIAVPDRLAFVTLGGVEWLAAAGLEEGRDYQLKAYGSHTNALFAVASGEAAAAFSSEGPCTQLEPEIRSRLRHFAIGQPMPHLVLLARPGLPAADLAALREHLTAFPRSEEGKTFFAESGYLGFIPLSPADQRAVRPYARKVARMLEGAP